MYSIRISPSTIKKKKKKNLVSMRREPLLPHLPSRKGLEVVLGRDNLIGRGVGDIVVVGLGNNNDCKGRLDGGGVVGEEV